MKLYLKEMKVCVVTSDSQQSNNNINFSAVTQRAKKHFFRLVKLIPSIRQKIENEMAKVSSGFEKDVLERTKNLQYITNLPASGISKDKLMELTQENLSLGKL